ncbi:TPA: hypothetical protein DEP58_05180 [Patescibacteria group bacterium]|nr:MAG: hypothetical protein UU98_C0012G0033 [Parcubacteria group bacterium GW2011_GWD2_42_14]HCC05659.1 hypothetical protein [Patescibacteria group bacterium]
MKEEADIKKELYKKPSHIFVIPVLIIRGILWFPALFLVHFFLRMEVKGKENLKDIPNGRVLFAANHSSEIDPYAFQYSLSFPSKFVPLYFVSLTTKYYPVAKFGLRSFIYGGLFFRLMGAYPVYKGLHDYESAFVNHIKILEKNHSVLIFPEGGMQKGQIGEARPGFIYLAKRTKATIVPVRILGTSNLNLKSIFSFQRKITIIFGKPISHTELLGEKEELSENELVKHAQTVMAIIKNLKNFKRCLINF